MIGQSSSRIPDVSDSLKRAFKVAGGTAAQLSEGVVPVTLVTPSPADPEYSSRVRWVQTFSIVGDATHNGYVAIANNSPDHALVIDSVRAVDVTAAAVFALVYGATKSMAGVGAATFNSPLLKNEKNGGTLGVAADVATWAVTNFAPPGGVSNLEFFQAAQNQVIDFACLPFVLREHPASYAAQVWDLLFLYVTSNTHTTYWTITGHYDP